MNQRRMAIPIAAATLATCALTGCGPLSVTYQGKVNEPKIDDAWVLTGDRDLPPDHDRMGSVEAVCKWYPARDEPMEHMQSVGVSAPVGSHGTVSAGVSVNSAKISQDIALDLIEATCAESNLIDEMRSEAADAGGTRLYALTCSFDLIERRNVRSCTAQVARGREDVRPLPNEGPGIHFSFARSPGQGERRAATTALELRAAAPAGHVQIGTLTVSCNDDCGTFNNLWATLRAEALQRGALALTHLVCSTPDDGVACRARAWAPDQPTASR